MLFFMLFRLFTALCLFALLVVSAHAALVDNIYQAQVPMPGNGEQAELQALQQGFAQVLVKASGNRMLPEQAEAQKAIEQARRYLLSFRYLQQDNQRVYQADFSPQLVDDLLRRLQQPIWDKRRPSTLIWLATLHQGRQLLGEGQDSLLMQAITQQAQQRGLPIVLPLLDLQDIQGIDWYDVWGGFTQRLFESSRRYQSDYVLSARIRQPSPKAHHNQVNNGQSSEDITPPDALLAPPAQLEAQQIRDEWLAFVAEQQETDAPWVVEWSLASNQSSETGQFGASSPEQAAAGLIDALADTLAARYAIAQNNRQGGSAPVVMTLLNISTMQAYQQATDFLQSLAPVVRVTLHKVQGSEVTVKLQLLGQQQDLVKLLSLTDKMRAQLNEFGLPGSELRYFWQP